MSNDDRATPPVSDQAQSKIIALDINADGLTDLLQMNSAVPIATWMAISRGNGEFLFKYGSEVGPLNNQPAGAGLRTRLFSGDFDGDGREDILNIQRDYD
jgi:hypothetical protein